MKDVYWTDKLYPCAADMDGITVDQLNDKLIEIHEMVFGMRRTAELLLADGLDSETMGMLRMVDALRFTEAHGEVCPAGWSKGKAGMKGSTAGVAEYLAQHAKDL